MIMPLAQFPLDGAVSGPGQANNLAHVKGLVRVSKKQSKDRLAGSCRREL